MKIFSVPAGNVTQPISQTYIPASEQMNMGSLPSFTLYEIGWFQLTTCN
jgi:hypothetical protein